MSDTLHIFTIRKIPWLSRVLFFTVALLIVLACRQTHADDAVLLASSSSAGIYAQASARGQEYRTTCRCAPEPDEFCQGTLGNTDIFLDSQGTLLRGADSSTCRDLWEYEFSYAIEKIAIDTTTKLVFFSSGNAVFALSLTEKELVFSHNMNANVKNISLQPRDRLSIDLDNGERHYVKITLSGHDATPVFEIESPEGSVAAAQQIPINSEISGNSNQQILVGPDESTEHEITIQYDNIAQIPFNDPEYTLTINHANAASITFTDNQNEEKQQELLLDNAKTNQSMGVVEKFLKSTWQCVQSISIKPGKYRKNKDFYINNHGKALISMDFLIGSKLCINYLIENNLIAIIGPNGHKLVINNLNKTIKYGNADPIKFGYNARPYRTSSMKYYIPLREVLELSGYKVMWMQKDKTIRISTT